MDSSQRQQIQEAGFEIESVVGDIFTGTGASSTVLKIADFDFVVYVEADRKLEKK